MFERIVHADWSKHPGGRWYACARRDAGGWRAAGPWPVGDVGTFVDRLAAFGALGPTLAAFDFPVGLPEAYGRTTGFTGFRGALDTLGGEGWERWFEPAVVPAEIHVRRPFYPAKPGSAKVRHLLDGLAVAGIDRLTRRTERGGPGTRAAGCMFWLVGAKTVGKAAIHGWRSVVAPAVAAGAKLWPFDGDLDALAANGGLVLAESYPGDATRQIGLAVRGKGDPAVLAALAPALLRWAADRRIELAPDLHGAIASGFSGQRTRCGDAFDAVVGLFAAIAVSNREHPDGAPATEAVRNWEGWILGRWAPEGIPDPPGAF